MIKRNLWLLVAIGATPAVAAPSLIDFAGDVQPIFEKSCYACHGSKLQMGGLRLDEKKAALAGGQSGQAIEPGKSAGSLLYRRVAGIGDQPRMPLGGKPLEPSQLAILRAWIDQGAAWPDGVGAQAAESKKHWAFIPPQRPELPPVRNTAWSKNPVDRFILARLLTADGERMRTGNGLASTSHGAWHESDRFCNGCGPLRGCGQRGQRNIICSIVGVGYG